MKDSNGAELWPGSIAAEARDGKSDNEQLNFVLASIGDPTAKPGVVPTPEVAQRSMSAMLRWARFEAYLAGMPTEEVWEEGLSRAMLSIGRSNLTLKYRPSQRGVAPYIKKIIRRCVRDVVVERRGYKVVPLPEELPTDDLTPAASAELRELLHICREALAEEKSRSDRITMPAQGKSTSHVRTHRHRKRAWNRVSHLFDERKFRTRRRGP